jgi:hypothetical protein
VAELRQLDPPGARLRLRLGERRREHEGEHERGKARKTVHVGRNL